MRKQVLLFGCILFVFQNSFSQTCPPNIDFEAGDFSNWQCYTGTSSMLNGKNIISLSASLPVSGRHDIITSTTAKDPFGNFPQLCPYGSNNSVKLGNSSSGSLAEGLSYTFTVPATIDTFTFTYFYAVVFENPGHTDPEQPRFFVTAYEVATGKVINCASYDYVSTGALPGFKLSAQGSLVLYKDWTPTSLQFAGLSGKEVRLEFKTADCTRGGHFGYAYLDVGSGCSNILATAPYCIETNSLLLNAPYGFNTYTWYNSNFSAVVGNLQSITLSPPPATAGVFWVDAIPYPGYGCRDTFQAVVKPLPVPDTPVAVSHYAYCQFRPALVLSATQSIGNDLLWYMAATGGIGSSVPPIPSTAVAGIFNYYVSQKVLFGCESFRKKITVTVTPTPVSAFTINALRQCQNGNQFTFTSTSTSRFKPVYEWDFGDGQTMASKTDSIVNHVYTNSGNFTVRLKVVNDSVCSAERTAVVVIIPKPVALYNFPAVVCQSQTQVALQDLSSVPGNVSTINTWWWSIGGTISTQKNPAVFLPATPGPLQVQLVATTQEGCRSDTVSNILDVHYRPIAAYRFTTPLCNNEGIHFTSTSTLPQAPATEFINKWSWQFNGITALQENSLLLLPAGVYSSRLIAESNFGCRSLALDSVFTVYAKPNIGLTISDSCVTRIISLDAQDQLNTVTNWYWDFGNGLFAGARQMTKVYNKVGANTVTLIGKTINGCKDTLIRPFTIYENKANAGRDTVAAQNEPVQLNARGTPGQRYLWTPITGLDSSNIQNPVALLDYDQLYRLYSITKEGCDNNSKILIRRYKGPKLYIPSGFTPNGDGKNDVLKVFPVGIKVFHHFTIYNRFGETVFHTKDYTMGWNGMHKKTPVETGAFIAIAEAIDYKGKLMSVKQTVMVIR